MTNTVQERLLQLVTTTVQKTLNENDIDEFYAQLQQMGPTEEVMPALIESFWLLWIRLDGTKQRGELVTLMKAAVKDKKVDRRMAMEVLDVECMHAAGLVENAEAWRKKEIRHNTKALYTVTKYNLLREDSEGYAKLVVALNHFGDAALEPHMVSALYQEIQGLIGYFDLDPNRVLDLVLCAAECQPHNLAYLKLVPLFKKEAVVHLLGFKFQHYQKPDVAPAWANLSLVAAYLVSTGLVDLDQLMHHLAPSDDDIRKAQEAAMTELKKEVDNIGVISLSATAAAEPGEAGGSSGSGGRAVVAAPEPMVRAPLVMGGAPQGGGLIASMRAAQQAGGGGGFGGMGGMSGMGGGGGGGGGGYMDDRGGGGGGGSAVAAGFRPTNQLRADAMCLDPALKYEALLLPKDAARNQKLALAQALLEVGAYEAAHDLMRRLASLGMQPAAWAPLSATLSHTVTEELTPVTNCLAPRGILTQGLLDAAQALLTKNGSAGGSASLPAGLPAGMVHGPPISARAVDALLTLGPFLGRNPRLLTKVIQAMRHHYLFYCIPPGGHQPDGPLDPHQGPAHASALAESARVEQVIGQVLLPASCLVPCMPALSGELWQLLKLLPFGTRYKLYSELKDQTERHPYLAAASRMAMYETRKVLKRLHSAPDKKDRKDACKPHGRLVAKIAAANPMTVLEVIVSQVEAYINQLEPLVEVLKYLTPLGFDTLTYVILSRLSMGRDKVKNDGINISDWLQSLAKFTGAVCRKYPDVDICALCHYLSNALRGADSFDLLVLKELVETLTGITVAADLSAEQLEGKLGGESLSSLVLMSDVERSRKAWTRGARRLLEALQRGPTRQHLALPLFVLVAQQRQAIMIHTEAQHIKFVVELYDKCHETCTQYIEFLQSALSADDYAALMPSLVELRSTYKIDPEVAFMAHRPMLQANLRELQREVQQSAPKPPAAEEGEIEPVVVVAGEDAMEVDGGGAGAEGGAGAKVSKAQAAWQEALEGVQASAPDPAVWEAISTYLYTLFWALTIHDVYVPTRAYETELDKVKADLRQIESSISSARLSAGSFNAMSEEDIVELARQRDRLKGLVTKLPAELEVQTERVNMVMALLAHDKDKLITTATDAKKKLTSALVTECVLPRLLSNPTDAFFCAKFIELLHNLSMPSFSTVWYFNTLIKDVIPALRCLTDREAVNMGVFLLETFRVINHWRSSEKVYNEECKSKPGFAIALSPGNDDRRTTYEQYRKLVFRWHKTAVTTIKSCLETTEYTSRRNVLTILNRLLPVFPVADKHVEELRRTVEKVRTTEQREDLQVLLKSYNAALNAEADKPNRVVPAEAFGEVLPAAKAKRPAPVQRPGVASANGSSSPSHTNRAPGSKAAPAPGNKPPAARAAAPTGTSRLKPEAGADVKHQPSGSPARMPAGPGPSAMAVAAAVMAVGDRAEVEDARASKRFKTEPSSVAEKIPLLPTGRSARGAGDLLAPNGLGAASSEAAPRPSMKREPGLLPSTTTPHMAGGLAAPSGKRARVEAPEPIKAERPGASSGSGGAGGERGDGGNNTEAPGGSGRDRRKDKEPRDRDPSREGKERERYQEAGGGGGGEKEGRERDGGKEFKAPKEHKEHREPKDSGKDHREPKESKEKERSKDKERDKDKERESKRERDKESKESKESRERSKDKEERGKKELAAATAQEEKPRSSRRQEAEELPPRERAHEPIAAPLSREGSVKDREVDGAAASSRQKRVRHKSEPGSPPAPDLRAMLQQQRQKQGAEPGPVLETGGLGGGGRSGRHSGETGGGTGARRSQAVAAARPYRQLGAETRPSDRCFRCASWTLGLQHPAGAPLIGPLLNRLDQVVGQHLAQLLPCLHLAHIVTFFPGGPA